MHDQPSTYVAISSWHGGCAQKRASKSDDKIDRPVDPKLLMSSMVSVERHCMFLLSVWYRLAGCLPSSPSTWTSPQARSGGFFRVLVLLKMCCHWHRVNVGDAVQEVFVTAGWTCACLGGGGGLRHIVATCTTNKEWKALMRCCSPPFYLYLVEFWCCIILHNFA